MSGAATELPPGAELLGREWVGFDSTGETALIRYQARPSFTNRHGSIQGGFLAAMLDDCMGPALWLMTKGEFFPATIAMTVCFLDSAAPGPLFGEGQVVRYGNTIAFLEGRLSNGSGRLLARATANARMVPAKRAVA